MIRAKHSIWINFFFNIYLSWLFRKHFHNIETIGEVKNKELPILVIANHISWWDGFWMSRLNNKSLKRKLYVMMLEEQLQKHRFFKKLGAFSIRKKSKTIKESLDYAAELLKSNKNILLIFPQGEIRSQHLHDFSFEKGLEYILSQTENPIQVIMVANVLDYFSKPKPTLKQYIFSPEKTTGFTCKELEGSYNGFFSDCIKQQTMMGSDA